MSKKKLNFSYQIKSFIPFFIFQLENAVVGICLAMIGRFFGISVMMISILFSGEIFPTMLRNTSMCIASASSRLFGILSPFLIYVGKLNLVYLFCFVQFILKCNHFFYHWNEGYPIGF